ncbi:MAG: metallophosphoesterase family protein [Candidatus Izemoplasmatales bacterium]|jgi:3',5'-cyclic AMP phosphodiesterase CpdA|nr:metallophosphoesterase family protein [Candidatus Izemoplasmatales bacterium]
MKQKLYVNDDFEFNILQLTDLHLMNNALNAKTLLLITNLVRKTQPDLIVITGDLTMHSSSRKLYDLLGAFLEEFKIFWTFVFGNHDTEGGVSKEELVNVMSKFQHCLFEVGDLSIHGIGNYSYIVHNRKEEPVMNLFFLDSNETRIDFENDSEIWSYDYIYPDQIDWYKQEIKKQVKLHEKIVPSLTFFHIPLREFKEIENLSKKEYSGFFNEPISCSKYNTGFFNEMKLLGSTKGVFVGHDHYNDFAFEKERITLAFGRVSGYYEYGNIPYEKGGRLIKIKEDGSFVTSIILESEV